MIRRINADFVPLALRAPAVNGANRVPDDDERWLYQRINRAKIAPQGICLLNSSGQVLTWVQMFDDDQSVLDFLDHGLERFSAHPDAKRTVATERYMRFPGEKVKEVFDETKIPPIALSHPVGKSCPAQDAKGLAKPGSVLIGLVGRALDAQGKPLSDTVKQEHYVEDQFSVSAELQQAVAKALAAAGTERVRLPAEFSKLCASHAHLGHIDVQPCLCMIKGRAENKGEWKHCQFWAQRVASADRQPPDGPTLWRVEGESEVVSELSINGKGIHDVKLAWQGFIEIKDRRLTQLVLSATGQEKLEFAKDDHPLNREHRDEVAMLPAGRPIDQHAAVAYGLLGAPVAIDPTSRQVGPMAHPLDSGKKR